MRELLKQGGGRKPFNSNSREEYYRELCRLSNEKEGELHLQDGYNCAKCRNKGFVSEAVLTDFGYWTKEDSMCECQTIRKSLRQIKKSGLEYLLQKYRLENYEVKTVYQYTIYNKALNYIQNIFECKDGEINPWFFIGGASGAGKTHICTAICKELLCSGMAVKYMLWRDESVNLKANIMNQMEYSARMKELKNIQILYVDDLFKQGNMQFKMPSEADLSLFFEIINYRYNDSKLITIISSEYVLSDILKFDEGIGSRICERCGNYFVNLTNDGTKNYRLHN